jgi:hypothetical protein
LTLLIQKWQYEEGRGGHIQFKIKKNYFLIPSVDVSENEKQTNEKPQAFLSSPKDFFKLLR